MEWAVYMSTLTVSSVSKNSSIVKWNLVGSWFICGRYSDFIYSSSNVVMDCWRCFNFESSMMYLAVRLFICPFSYFSRKFSLRA